MVHPIDREVETYEDNEGGIKTATNRFSSRRVRHIDVKHHMLRDVVDEGVIKVKHTMSREQHADASTKALGVETLDRHRDLLLKIRT